ncbi:hypothetical protein BBO99_00007846 [Phytophthora kernoviae]|uniref:Uncharacterized protein n=2 Tax=Phytophthora kernoviae TaxID=325452 RepID=A0A3R7MLB8_9STRA|nr:hypothetical protein G195_007939 [Phytophthora kernoviae 00238/432]KAG2515767.1 hypothetical protein JM18_008134 [Phytophthora kernoviae]KAG2517210.1 hypothetical protein JM16_007488 [Phytophthora kernoviae]RLN06044.1 hypothetical protein BBI17_007764 [Phytophthora kernoviae]RLN76060.1 hypothetical protein BBO99_00007846 [Phytophthora kernoviae]
MSGRAYARNPRAPFAGPRDLEAILPHTFRLEAPLRLNDARHQAIRSAIRRRCMQKNWKKMISIRHRRLEEEVTAETQESESKTSSMDVNSDKDEKDAEKSTREEEQEQGNAVDTAKKQLEELELKLQGLTDQKHAKFQMLKDILVEEARSKMSGGSVAAGGGAKKRRVEFKDGSMTPSPAKLQSPSKLEAGHFGSPTVAEE